MTVSFAAVIPTRNRGLLAAGAAQSLLAQECPIEVFVSDNSTTPSGVDVELGDDPRVVCLRPDREMSAADHWDWALRQAMDRSSATHFLVVHDRRRTKPQVLPRIAAIAAARPEEVITVGTDLITSDPPPFRVWQMPWTGNVFAMRSARAAKVIAGGRVPEAVHALPVMASSIVPRGVLESIVTRFGDVCRSTGPDLAFLTRFLALHDSYVHYDCATGILHASERSTGLGFLRGRGADFADFVQLLDGRPWLDAAPVPGLSLGSNMVYHEYECARRETGDRLPPLDRQACLRELGASLCFVDDAERREQLQAVLRSHGWDGESRPSSRSRSWRASVAEVFIRLSARFGDVPLGANGLSFRTDHEALRWALRHRRRKQGTHEHLDILEPEVVSP